MSPTRLLARIVLVAAVLAAVTLAAAYLLGRSPAGGDAAVAASNPVTSATRAAGPPPPGFAVATFAGGCFWCMETQYEGRPGIRDVVSGYAGGRERNPTYEQVGSGMTGHAESVQITYDPKQISYETLLDLFWHGIDPTQANGQFCDRGPQYRSAIFVRDSTERGLAEASKRRIEASGRLRAPIVTRIVDATAFYPAEEYHQDFWRKDPLRYRTYRAGCGRDRRLAELWGKDAVKPLVH
jgi:peptide-methionine (S)-S-oxide reductase